MKIQKVYDAIALNTENYEKNTTRDIRKKNSQYFTPFLISKYMTNIIIQNGLKKTMHVLEPSGGTGSLVTIFLLELVNMDFENIIVDIFELDEKIITILKTNLSFIETVFEEKGKKIRINIKCENFLKADIKVKYDIIIGNPPYKKIRKNSPEAMANSSFLYGQPNIYGLFLGKSLKLLNTDGKLVFLVPRSFFNGKYFSRIREFMYKNYSLTFIHSFESRIKVINNEILQEIVIVKIEKKKVNNVLVNHSLGIDDIDINKVFVVEKKFIWDKNSLKIRLPITTNDVEIIKKMDKLVYKLADLNLKFNTGPVVDFRVKNFISGKKMLDKYYPLIWCANFGLSSIRWPIYNLKYPQYISADVPKVNLLSKGNYLIVKRFSSKEENKYLKINIIRFYDINFEKFALENHVNYLNLKENDEEFLKGLFILLNSSLYNRYFAIINGTTQINITDLNELPILQKNLIRELGKITENIDYCNRKIWDNLVNKYVEQNVENK